MSKWEIVRRRASIAGVIVDAVTQAPVPGALVAIASGPAAFEALTGPDGLYYFMDLPAGTYDLGISVPAMGSRYGTYTRTGVQVGAADPGAGPVWPEWAATPIQSTCVTGQVTRAGTKTPIARVQVWLRGDTNVALTDASGTYTLSGLVVGMQSPGSITPPGTATVQVSASGYKPASQPTVLAAGQKQTVDVSLDPA